MSAAKKSGFAALGARAHKKIRDGDQFPMAGVKTKGKVIENCSQPIREL